MTQNPPPKPRWRVTSRMRGHARALRRDMTLAERRIWHALRAHRLEGAGFRRQMPIGPYIVDFASHECGLIIEIDGGQHFEDKHETRDAIRDAYLRARGSRVLRFNNYDAMRNREGVLEVIVSAVLEARAPSLPSPSKRAFTPVFDGLCGGGGEALPSVREGGP
jgi:very-short-patch-repair endonuclease